METSEAVQLISTGEVNWDIPQRWADLGCGTGVFTRALGRLLAVGSFIYAVDLVDQQILPEKEGVGFQFIRTDFTSSLPFSQLDGVLMANALHYVQEQEHFLINLIEMLRPGGRLLFVEYDTTESNPWVPYPVSLQQMARLTSGIGELTKLGRRHSVFGPKELYACLITVR